MYYYVILNLTHLKTNIHIMTLSVQISKLINSVKTYLWVERFLPNGDYSSGRVCVTDASDTASGAGYISVNTTFTGDGILYTTPV